MPGRVIAALRASRLASALTDSELRTLSNAGRLLDFAEGQTVLPLNESGDTMVVLREGRIRLHLQMYPHGGLCGGEADVTIDKPGDVFGWSTWVRADRVVASALALSAGSAVVLDVDGIGEPDLFSKLGNLMIADLYGLLHSTGICAPEVRGDLRLTGLLYRPGVGGLPPPGLLSTG